MIRLCNSGWWWGYIVKSSFIIPILNLAKTSFEKSLALFDHPASAYNLGLVQFNAKNYKTAAYNFRSALHFSANSDTPNELRAFCHYYLGQAKLIALGNKETVPYKALLGIATHLHKAVKYGNKPMFKEAYDSFLGDIKDEGVKFSLSNDSMPMELKSGILKGGGEILSSDLRNASVQEREEWGTYSDPRKTVKHSIGQQPTLFNKNNNDSNDNHSNVKSKTSTNNNSSNQTKPSPK